MIYLFNHGETLIGMLKSTEINEAIQEETLNGMVRLDFSVKLPYKEKMKEVEFVAHADANEPDFFYMYKLISSANSDTAMNYVGINIAFDDLKGYGYIREQRMEKTTGALGLETILHGSRWHARIMEGTKQADLYLYDNTRLEALSKLIDTFGVELDFRVQISGNKITGRYVDLYNERGTDTGKRFYYGRNALEVVKEEDQTDIFTAVIGRGKGEQKFDTSNVEATGGFGRRINFKDVAWSKANGDPLDKPLGQEYLELPEATAKYGYSDGTPRFKIVVHDKIEDPLELLNACYTDLINGSRPLVQFKSTLQKVGTLRLGDRVRIVRKDLDIYYSARVFKIKRNLLNLDATIVELGDNLDYSQSKKNKEVINQLKDLNSRVDEVVDNAQLTFVEVVKQMTEEMKNTYFNEDGYNYEMKTGNEYNLPAGYYSFNAPIDQNPSKVIYMGAGMMAIANKKDANGNWDFRTFGTGDGLLAETIVGTLGEFAKVNANQINVNNDFATTELGKKVVVQDELYNNVKITQAKGIQVLDNLSRERVQLGNWAVGRYGLRVTDTSGNRTVLDDQGILQTWQDGRCDNIDNGKPLRLRVFIPRETNVVYKALLRLYMEAFRAYSKGASYGGSTYTSTSSGGGQYVGRTTDYAGEQSSTTHTMADVQGGMQTVYTKTSAGIDYGRWIDIYQTTHHEHRYAFGSHAHDASISINDHSHSVQTGSHAHDLEYGIYEDSSVGKNMEIFINGSDRTAALTGSGYMQYTQPELVITPYLAKGQWNTIEIRSSGRARVDASIFIQALIQFPG